MRRKRSIIIIAAALLAITTAALLAVRGRYPSKAVLRIVMEEHDPSTLELAPAYNDYVRRASLTNGAETGIILMKDGASSQYWFRSHHRGDDIGGTWFRMSDGTTSYMAGWFCCEVQLPEEQMASLDDLKAFIRRHHGTSP